jgi:hypothetical protein
VAVVVVVALLQARNTGGSVNGSPGRGNVTRRGAVSGCPAAAAAAGCSWSCS